MSRLKVFADARQVTGREEAEDFLQDPSPASVQALAERADELRFTHPAVALGVSSVAVKALKRIRSSQALRSQVWAIHGSALRSQGELERAEFALVMAAKEANNELSRANTARRLATLRAEQRRAEDARTLVPQFLERARRIGGQTYAEELVAAGALLIIIEDFAEAKDLTAEALRLLQLDGGAIHLAAVGNLCRCHLELASDREALDQVISLARETEALVSVGDYTHTKFRWLRSRLQLRIGDAQGALKTLLAIQPEIVESGKAIDCAILSIDVAQAHLELGDVSSAAEMVLNGFPLLAQLRTLPEAFKAIRTLHESAAIRKLESHVLAEARRTLERIQ